MGLHKILKIIAILLSVVGIIFYAMILVKGDEAIATTGEGLDGILYVSYIIFALTIAFVLFFVVHGIFTGNVKCTFLSIGAFLLVVVISYVLADGTPMALPEGDMLSASGSKWVGAGLYAFYIMAILAIGAMIYTGIRKLIR